MDRHEHVVLGLVGAGRIGHLHARHLLTLPGVELHVTDPDRDRAQGMAETFGLPVAANVEALLEADVDGLLIAARTEAHPELVRTGVAADLPVFCEKPLASTLSGTRALSHDVETSGGLVQVGFQRRFDAGFVELRRALAAGELGTVHAIRATTCDVEPPSVQFLQTSGGLFVDCSSHDFDAIRFVTGREVAGVQAWGRALTDDVRVAGDIDSGLVVLHLDDGTQATVIAARYNGGGYDARLEVQGSRATLVAGLDSASPLRSSEVGTEFPSGVPHPDFAGRFEAAYRAELAGFVDLVRRRSTVPRCTAADAVAAAEIAEAAQLSLASGEPVRPSSLTTEREQE